jgi:hypothetical protein
MAEKSLLEPILAKLPTDFWQFYHYSYVGEIGSQFLSIAFTYLVKYHQNSSTYRTYSYLRIG